MLKKETQEKSCCNFKIVDMWGELFIIIGGAASLAGLIYSAITNITVIIIVSSISVTSALVAQWRIRNLVIPNHLIDSVDGLTKDNEKLRDIVCLLENENVELKKENKNFEGLIGLLNNDVGNVDDTKNKLFRLYQGYIEENDRYEGNNLLSLFKLVDKNNDDNLSTEEMKKMSKYTKAFYGQEFNFNNFNKNQDGTVSIEEFVSNIKKQRNARKLDII